MKRRAGKDDARDNDVEGMKPFKGEVGYLGAYWVVPLGPTRTDRDAINAIVVLALYGIKPYRPANYVRTHVRIERPAILTF